MPKVWYSFKLRCDVPMLDETEWLQVAEHLASPIEAVKRLREREGLDLVAAKRRVFADAADAYFSITGERLESDLEIHATRMAAYGPPCPMCRKPFRTLRARLCAECGHELPTGQRAADLGRLEDY